MLFGTSESPAVYSSTAVIGLQDAIPKITLIRVSSWGIGAGNSGSFFVLEMSDKHALCFNVCVAWGNIIYVNRTEHGTESQ